MSNIGFYIAALIFLCFSFLFWQFGNSPLRFFAVRQRFEEEEEEFGDSESKKFREAFLKDFDGYLASINKRNKFRYWIAAGGFFLAALISVLLAISVT